MCVALLSRDREPRYSHRAVQVTRGAQGVRAPQVAREVRRLRLGGVAQGEQQCSRGRVHREMAAEARVRLLPRELWEEMEGVREAQEGQVARGEREGREG